MEIKANLKHTRLSPQKGRLMADLIRGKKVDEALNILSFMNKKSANILSQLLRTAMANAEEKNVDDVDAVTISRITIDGGPVWKRQMPRARGRATVILKRTSHIAMVLKEE